MIVRLFRRGSLAAVCAGAMLSSLAAEPALAQLPVCQPARAPSPECAPPPCAVPPPVAREVPAPAAPTAPSFDLTPSREAPTDTLSLGGGLSAAAGGQTIALNMFGDAFGTGLLPLVLQGAPIVIPGMTRTVTGLILDSHGTPVAYAGSPALPFSGSIVTFHTTGQPAGSLGALPIRPDSFTFQSASTITAPPLPQQIPLVENTNLTRTMAAFARPGESTVFGGGAAVSPQSVVPSANNYSYNIDETYLFVTPTRLIPQTALVLLVPSPADGNLAGRTKISDDNNPLPRDRVIVNYDYFDNAQLSSQGVPVHRFSMGFEKTFFDQRASIEVRVPFASTANNDFFVDGVNGGGHVEFGDINITLKALLYGGPVLNVAAGLGIATPTADDLRIFLANGTPLARINNDAVVLTPYFAFLLTPTDRWFFQNWYEFSFDANGNEVLANPDFTGLRGVGRLNDQGLFQVDAQLGYWLYRSTGGSGWLRGLAPFLELHYNSTMGRADAIAAGALTIGDPRSHLDELNLAAGFSAQVGDGLLVSVGAVAPLKGHEDRTFDWQIGIHASWFFGPSAVGAGAPAARVSNF
jgi:hypothetical protein